MLTIWYKIQVQSIEQIYNTKSDTKNNIMVIIRLITNRQARMKYEIHRVSLNKYINVSSIHIASHMPDGRPYTDVSSRKGKTKSDRLPSRTTRDQQRQMLQQEGTVNSTRQKLPQE